MDDHVTCVVCEKSITPDHSSSKLTKKVCDGINTASIARHSDICASPGQHGHKDCCQVFINDRYIEQAKRKRLCRQGDPRQGRDAQFTLHIQSGR